MHATNTIVLPALTGPSLYMVMLAAVRRVIEGLHQMIQTRNPTGGQESGGEGRGMNGSSGPLVNWFMSHLSSLPLLGLQC